MTNIRAFCVKCHQIARDLTRNCDGQDIIEYALMAGFVAVGVVGMSPAVATSFVTMMSKANSVVILAGAS
jgi:Flp pilus assembly pilin Flp